MPPAAPAAPEDLILDCAEDVPDPFDLTAMDNCDGGITVSPTEELTPGNCINQFVIVRTWTFTDATGNFSSVSQKITVDDTTPPEITCPAEITINCDILPDPPEPEYALAIDNCDGSPVISYQDDEEFGTGDIYKIITRTWTAIDACDNSSFCTQTINLINIPISILEISAPLNPQPINSTVSVSATYFGNTPDFAEWNWGDETTSDGMIGSEIITGNHAYGEPGVYTISLTVEECNATDSKEYQYVVVYDPSGGFVTGGGWIDSPSGAYIPDLSLEGKANFGFVSKYNKGPTVPAGNTEFQFKTGDLNFNSYEYYWLVIAGSKAKFKGEGTINGTGEFGFMLSAIDGDLNSNGGEDMFRIKIWDKLNGDVVVYDNQIMADDNTDPTTSIAGGSIVIHTKDNLKSAAIIEPSTKLNIYPNPFDNSINIDLFCESSYDIIIDMIDMNGRVVEYLYMGVIAAEVDHHFEFNTTAGLTPGIYMLRIRTDNGEPFGREIVIKR